MLQLCWYVTSQLVVAEVELQQVVARPQCCCKFMQGATELVVGQVKKGQVGLAAQGTRDRACEGNVVARNRGGTLVRVLRVLAVLTNPTV